MKDNKFLTGLLILTLLGAGVLGFFLFQAKGKYSEALDAYNTKIGELQTLQGSKPFPDQENLGKMRQLQAAHQEVINSLQRELASAEFPVKELRPNEFQDKLKQTVDRVHQEAATRGVELPKEKGAFALGFDRYLSEPPKPEVTPALGRMLEAVEKVTMLLIDTAPSSIKDIKRTPLPGEAGAPTPPPAPAPKGGAGSKKTDTPAQAPLVQRYPFEVEFTASEFKVRTFINSVVAEKKQFYIPASIAIVNEQVAGPSKVQATAEAGAAPAAPADPAAPAPAAADATAVNPAAAADVPKFIVGEERLNVAMRIEVVDFAEPPAEKPAAEKSPAKKSSK